MKTKSVSRRALVVTSIDSAEPTLIDSLGEFGFDYELIEAPEDALKVPRECSSAAFDLAVVLLEYPSMSGPELAWRLRRRHPTVPILMLADELGTWEASDIYDLGVNFLLEGVRAGKSVRSQLLPLLEGLVSGADDPARFEEYDRLVKEATGGEPLPARIINSRRIIVYENSELRELVGRNTGRNCFEFWGAKHQCSECIGMAAIETAQRLTRVMRTASGERLRVDAVPIVLDDGNPAVIEIFRFIDAR